MILKVTTQKDGTTTIDLLGPGNTVQDSLSGSMEIMRRQAHILWGVWLDGDGEYPLF